MLRISARLVYGQTGPRRVSRHTPAEVVAQGGDTERVVQLADNVLDQTVGLILLVAMTLITGSVVPGLFFLGTMVLSGLAATAFGPRLERAARDTVAARAAFATALVSTLSAARTVKLAGATRPVLTHLANLDTVRSERQRREIAVQVWARSTPAVASGLFPIGVWALFLTGRLSAGAALVAVATLGAARWFAWTTASLISQVPSARVWTRRTAEMTGIEAYSARVPGVDLAAGTAPAPTVPPRTPLRRLELVGFGVRHTDGTTAVRDVDLTVARGQLVLVVGPVGSGKSSLLRALAGIAPHTGLLTWNGEPVTEPELFLRPNQVGYVGQLPGCSPARSRTTSPSGIRWTPHTRSAPPSSTTTWPPPAAGSACSSGTRAPGCPVGSCNGWRWPGRWRRVPNCWWPTTSPPRWTSPPSWRCGRHCGTGE